MAHGKEPRPPALETAMAIALPCTPAMGAWMMGNSMPISSCRRVAADMRGALFAAQRRFQLHTKLGLVRKRISRVARLQHVFHARLH